MRIDDTGSEDRMEPIGFDDESVDIGGITRRCSPDKRARESPGRREDEKKSGTAGYWDEPHMCDLPRTRFPHFY